MHLRSPCRGRLATLVVTEECLRDTPQRSSSETLSQSALTKNCCSARRSRALFTTTAFILESALGSAHSLLRNFEHDKDFSHRIDQKQGRAQAQQHHSLLPLHSSTLGDECKSTRHKLEESPSATPRRVLDQVLFLFDSVPQHLPSFLSSFLLSSLLLSHCHFPLQLLHEQHRPQL